jgi:hypothetical protein
VEEEQGAASNELAQKVVELGTEGVGTAAWMHARWHGAAGPLIVLRTDTEEQRQTVYELTGVLVAPLDFEAAHTVGQSATQSTKWMQQKTRRTLNFNPLLEALKAGPAKPFAKLLEKQDGGCAFFYNGIKHKDKSLTNERVMLRLTQTPKKIHYLMVEGADHIVYYNIEMKGPCAQGVCLRL